MANQPSRRSSAAIRVLAGSLLLALASSLPAAGKSAPAATNWSPQAAAKYLDSREVWWQTWDRAQKDHGTLCISCHTQASYGLARPVLRGQLREQGPSPSEQVMLTSIEKRVRGWKDMEPFYSDDVYGTGKEIESRNAESPLTTWYSVVAQTAIFVALSALTQTWQPQQTDSGWVALVGISIATTAGIFFIFLCRRFGRPFSYSLIIDLEPLIAMVLSMLMLAR